MKLVKSEKHGSHCFHPSPNPPAWKIVKEFPDDAGEVRTDTILSKGSSVSVNVGVRREFQPYPRWVVKRLQPCHVQVHFTNKVSWSC